MGASRIAGYRGFSLVEVMVSIFILAVGIIGALGMQMAALRTMQQSVFQSTALQLASDMAGVIRMKHSVLRADNDAPPFPEMDYLSEFESEPVAPSKLCYFSTCTPEEFVDFEVYEWKMRIKSALPNGRMRICHDDKAWNPAEKTLTWDCHGGGKAPLVIKLGWQAKNPDGSVVRDASGAFPPIVALTVTPA